MSSHGSPLRVEVRPGKDATIVKLTGSAGMEVAGKLRDQLLSLINAETRRLIVDMSELEFINSVGLGGIVAAHLRCRKSDGEVHLVSPQPSIRALLELTKLTKLFSIHDSIESAIAQV